MDELLDRETRLMTEFIVMRYGPVLNNKEAAEVLKRPEWKMCEVPREELPRGFGRGRGGIRIMAHHLAQYVVKNFDLTGFKGEGFDPERFLSGQQSAKTALQMAA